jgi:uncharacterized protein
LTEKIKELIHLQRMDSELVKMTARKKMLPDQLGKLDEAFQAHEAGVEEDRKKLEELKKEHKAREDRLKKNQEALKKAKDRLLEVKTNKEYQAMLKEIDGIDGKNGEIEEGIIVLMEQIDQSRSAMGLREKEQDACKSDYDEKRKVIAGELTSLDAAFLACQQEIQELRKQIPSDLLKRYESIKHVNNGLAIVAAWKELCQGCHMNIPPQFYNELQKATEIMSCPHCHRIIYWEDQNVK